MKLFGATKEQANNSNDILLKSWRSHNFFYERAMFELLFRRQPPCRTHFGSPFAPINKFQQHSVSIRNLVIYFGGVEVGIFYLHHGKQETCVFIAAGRGLSNVIAFTGNGR